MSLTVTRLDAPLGAEVTGLTLTDDLPEETIAEIRAAWLEHLVLVFRDQSLEPKVQADFSRRLGPLERHTVEKYIHPEESAVFVISNVKKNGQHVGAPKSGRHWHSDSQFLKVPSDGSLLYGVSLPDEGGDTCFANMYAAYDALPEETKAKIDGKRILCSRVKAWPVSYPDRDPLTEEQKAKLPDVDHPLVRTHPETGRKSLYIGGNVVWEIIGMDFDEGRALLDELRAHATQDRFVYRHQWRPGDAVMWDNRCTMHLATGFDESRYDRLMHRTTLAGSVPV